MNACRVSVASVVGCSTPKNQLVKSSSSPGSCGPAQPNANGVPGCSVTGARVGVGGGRLTALAATASVLPRGRRNHEYATGESQMAGRMPTYQMSNHKMRSELVISGVESVMEKFDAMCG